MLMQTDFLIISKFYGKRRVRNIGFYLKVVLGISTIKKMLRNWTRKMYQGWKI